jgi:hypothetical protein
VLTVTIVLIPLKSYDFQKAYLTLYYGAYRGIAAFLMVQTIMLSLTAVKLPLDRTEPKLKAANLKAENLLRSQNSTSLWFTSRFYASTQPTSITACASLIREHT